MSPGPRVKIEIFANIVYKGMLGILSEIVLISCIISAGLLVGLIWWGAFK